MFTTISDHPQTKTIMFFHPLKPQRQEGSTRTSQASSTESLPRICRVISAWLLPRSGTIIMRTHLQTLLHAPLSCLLTHLSLPSVVLSTVDASLKEQTVRTTSYLLLHLNCIPFCTSHSCTVDAPIFFPPKRLGSAGPSTTPGTTRSLTPQLLLLFLGYL